MNYKIVNSAEVIRSVRKDPFLKGTVQVKSKMERKDWADIVAYVTWTISVYILSYYTLKKTENVDMIYQIGAMLLLISCIWLYKIETKELTKEIIKSTLILVGTTIFPYFTGDNNVEIQTLVELVICNMCNAAIGYAMIFYIRKSRSLHGNSTYKLESATLIVTALLMFVFKYGIVFSLIVAGVFNLFVGFFIFRKNLLNVEKSKNHVKYPCSKRKEKRRKKRK